MRVGANVQPGQLVEVRANVEFAPLAREVVRSAYRAGARYVQVNYGDEAVRRAAVDLAPDSALGWTPPSTVEFLEALGLEHGASVNIMGDPDPWLFEGADETRVGKSRPVAFRQTWSRLVGEGQVNWTIVACPTELWAKEIFGTADLERLWTAVEHAVRLDEPDPAAAWQAHVRRLDSLAARLTELRLKGLRYRGPGTDLKVGLLPSSVWHGSSSLTSFGVTHVANLPTEEVFTSPDRRQAEGVVRSTRPLVLNGIVVEELTIRFAHGEAVEVTASRGAQVVRSQMATDPGARRLGEVALVDRRSRVGDSGLTFYLTLLDENATSHLAFGHGFAFAVSAAADREAGLNVSGVHTDFMVGGEEVDVDGETEDGRVIPILRQNAFCLE